MVDIVGHETFGRGDGYRIGVAERTTFYHDRVDTPVRRVNRAVSFETLHRRAAERDGGSPRPRRERRARLRDPLSRAKTPARGRSIYVTRRRRSAGSSGRRRGAVVAESY